MVARLRRLGQLALLLDLDALAVLAQPRLGCERALGRPELEHATPASQSLAHGAPPVDLLAGHDRGTSWKPSSESRTSQPSASPYAALVRSAKPGSPRVLPTKTARPP